MITSINKESYPDTLIAILGPDKGRSNFDERKNVTQVTDDEGNVTGFNFFNTSLYLDYADLSNGQVYLDQDQIDTLNDVLKKAGFDYTLQVSKPTIVYGYVKTLKPHPDSDHLQIATVDVGLDHDIQIVSGSPNIKQGIKVVVALPGTLMPNGAQIWDGELRGVESYGMICSARELKLKHAPQRRGLMILPDDFKVGEKFDPQLVDDLLVAGDVKM